MNVQLRSDANDGSSRANDTKSRGRALHQQARAQTSALALTAALAALSFSLPGCADAADESELDATPSVEREAEVPLRDERVQPEVRALAQVAPYALPSSASTQALSAAPPTLPDEAGVSAPPAQLGVQGPTMTTSGRQLLDSCGMPFVTRGVEQIFGQQLPEGNDWGGLIEQIASAGVNAVRILAGTDTLSIDDVDELLLIVGQHDMAAYVTPYGDEGMRWLEGADVRAMLAKHEQYIIIDAFGEPTFDDRERFVTESTDAIRQVREWGYRVPLTVTANQFGRDLPSVLELGAEIAGADPLGNTILGWQAYWGSAGFYQEHYGFSLTEAVQAVAQATFPIQLGLDRVTDFPSTQTADYGALLSATEAHGIGWLWWDWYNPYGNENNLTEDGSATSLTATGANVVSTHPASIQNTSKLACQASAP